MQGMIRDQDFKEEGPGVGPGESEIYRELAIFILSSRKNWTGIKLELDLLKMKVACI